MVTSEFQTFFLASVGASAALIGLLFVSVSIAPERVFGGQSDVARQAQALSAFTALTNIFFISLMSLIPEVLFGLVVWIVCVPARCRRSRCSGTRASGARSESWCEDWSCSLFSAGIYAYEFTLGIQMWIRPTDKGALIGLLFVLIGAYAVGLGRAWELLGAPRTGFIAGAWDLLSAARREPPAGPQPKS
jgi:hypothetical protein